MSHITADNAENCDPWLDHCRQIRFQVVGHGIFNDLYTMTSTEVAADAISDIFVQDVGRNICVIFGISASILYWDICLASLHTTNDNDGRRDL